MLLSVCLSRGPKQAPSHRLCRYRRCLTGYSRYAHRGMCPTEGTFILPATLFILRPHGFRAQFLEYSLIEDIVWIVSFRDRIDRLPASRNAIAVTVLYLRGPNLFRRLSESLTDLLCVLCQLVIEKPRNEGFDHTLRRSFHGGQFAQLASSCGAKPSSSVNFFRIENDAHANNFLDEACELRYAPQCADKPGKHLGGKCPVDERRICCARLVDGHHIQDSQAPLVTAVSLNLTENARCSPVECGEPTGGVQSAGRRLRGQVDCFRVRDDDPLASPPKFVAPVARE